MINIARMINYGVTKGFTQKFGTIAFGYNSIKSINTVDYNYLHFNLFRVVQAAILDFSFCTQDITLNLCCCRIASPAVVKNFTRQCASFQALL